MSNKREFIQISDSDSESLEPDIISSDHDDSYDDSDSGSDYAYNDDETECKDSVVDLEDEGYVDINNVNDEESVCSKVIQFIQGESNVRELKLAECRVFFRRHGLRLSGSKEECVERIKEFLRLKDGNGEAFYPRSSFMINCTGDVCKGDVVLFTQKVHNTFDKMKRHGSVIGSRTIAGRIVKESYGATRQQHTFTVEVLWSRGTNKLAPLVPLLVKGRNLYKRKTFRQRWDNEKKRLDVLDEKHRRGAAARTVRDMRRNKCATNTSKSSTSKGAKRHKLSHHLDSSRSNPTKGVKNGVNKRGKVPRVNQKLSHHKNKRTHPFQALNSKQAQDLRGPASSWRAQNIMQENQIREPPHFPDKYSSENFNHFHLNTNSRGPYQLPFSRGSVSMMRPPHPQPLPNPVFRPISQNHEFRHGGFVYPAYPHSHHYVNDSRFPSSMDYRFPHLPYTDAHRWR